MASDVSCFWWSECYFLSSSYLVVWNLSISHKLDIDTWDYFQCSVFKVPYNLLRKLLREIAARFSVFLPKRFATLVFLNRNSFISIPWRQRDSNSRPPACKAGALPTELHPHLIWRPPALPHRLQCSTIGRLRLNRRVRDGNGCFPQAHRHQKYGY